MNVKVICAGEAFPLHLVLLLDASSSMSGDPEREMRAAALHFVESFAVDGPSGRRIGVVQAGRVRTVLRLSSDQEAILTAVKRVRSERELPATARPPGTPVPDGGGPDQTQLDRAFHEAHKVLIRGRAGLDRDTLTEVLVVMSDGKDPQGCDPALEQARKVRGDGILMVSVCVGRDCQEECMRQLASSPRYYFRAENTAGLAAVFQQIRDRLINIVVRDLEIVEVPGEGIETLPAGAVPAPDAVDASTGALTWRAVYVPRDGITVTYLARPLASGTMPLARSSGGTFRDNKARFGSFRFEDLWLTAVDPDVLSAPRLGPGPTPPAGP
jgi:hypothetical protein